MKIIIYPDRRLRIKSKKVTMTDLKTTEMQRFILDLVEIMKKEDGIGIAAPQAGKNIRIIVISTENGPIPFVNPKIIWKSIKREIGEEGCLSIPEKFGLVKRCRSVSVIYWDKEGKRKKEKAKGLFARVLQHEIDHLNGVLFIDKMIKKTAGGY